MFARTCVADASQMAQLELVHGYAGKVKVTLLPLVWELEGSLGTAVLMGA